MFDIKALFSGYPEIIQYVLVIGIVLILIYISLLITRVIGNKYGSSKVYYDDPIAYDKTIPALFGNKLLHRKPKAKTNESSAKPEAADAAPAENSDKSE